MQVEGLTEVKRMAYEEEVSSSGMELLDKMSRMRSRARKESKLAVEWIV